MTIRNLTHQEEDLFVAAAAEITGNVCWAYRSVVNSLRPCYTDEISTVGVDSSHRLYLSDYFFKQDSPLLRVGLLMHEVMHVASEHFQRQIDNNMTHAEMNFYGDLESNSIIKTLGSQMKLPADGLFPSNFDMKDNETMEWYRSNDPNRDRFKSKCTCSSDDNGDKQESQDSGSNKDKNNSEQGNDDKSQNEQSSNSESSDSQQEGSGSASDGSGSEAENGDSESAGADSGNGNAEDGSDGEGSGSGNAESGSSSESGSDGSGSGSRSGDTGSESGDGGQGDSQGQGKTSGMGASGDGNGYCPVHSNQNKNGTMSGSCANVSDDMQKRADKAGIERASESEQQNTKDALRADVQEMAQQIKQGTSNYSPNGAMDNLLQCNLDFLKPPVVPWQTIVRKISSSSYTRTMKGRKRPTYKKVSRRRTGSDFIYPGTVSNVPKLSFGLDQSGSMGKDDTAAAIFEVEGIFKSKFGKNNIEFFSVDTQVGKAQKVRTLKDIKLTGGGGTNMEPGFRFVLERKKANRPDVFALCTDGEFPVSGIVSAVEDTVASGIVVVLMITTDSASMMDAFKRELGHLMGNNKLYIVNVANKELN